MLLGYSEWRNFAAFIDRAITACENSGYDHFANIGKMVVLGSGAKREMIPETCSGQPLPYGWHWVRLPVAGHSRKDYEGVRMREKKHLVREEPAGYEDGAIVLYQAPDGSMSIDVRLEKETLWMDAHQMARLFGRDRSVIVRHIRNIYETNELDPTSTCAKNAQVAADGKLRQMDLYNLDVIIGVGYRVNSLRGTQFRTWATQVLRDHLVRGYSVNAKRLKELQQSLKLVGQVLERYDVTSDQARALLRVVADYEFALDLLDDYDHQRVSVAWLKPEEARGIDYDEAMAVIGELRRKFGGSDLFGREKDQSLRGSLGAVMQSFDGKDLYPSLEEKAAHLLYFLVKDHSFVDGNKRIGAALFLWFMEKNGILYRADGSRHIADNALVAITLMIAESNPHQKDILTKVVVNLIKNRKCRMAKGKEVADALLTLRGNKNSV